MNRPPANPKHQHEGELLVALLELPLAERAAFLERECGANAALRQRLEKLLLAHDESGAFLEKAAVCAAPVSPSRAVFDGVESKTLLAVITEKPGDCIGRYKLLQQIGEGGCGVVYMAEQEEPVRRRVALKVIKLGMDTKQVIARFEAERQALALMDHPNIAKVLDAAATETGRPYFVMELVRGIKITDYCDQNNLSTRVRLDLFIQVCHAIQHAHQKGIIHRDIKPSNILVSLQDGVPVPVVINFGIAKATEQRLTDKTLFTAFEQFIGTPAYMSPEQAELSRLDIDTRSDIYALGVLLYELLTGKTPFDAKTLVAAGLEEMRRIIREEEPVRPSTRITQERLASSAIARNKSTIRNPQSAIDPDLDWIVMKCLEKDRTRRYETANGLAMDIERHLSHQPVIARPPSTIYRTQKFIRRKKLVVTAAGLIAITLLLGIAVSTRQAVRATRAEREQSRQRRLAIENERKAREAQSNEEVQRILAETKAEESRQRLVQINVANGVRLMNDGQLFASLPWLVEALRLEQGNPEGEDLQRRRLGAVLDHCPKLAQIWFHDGPVRPGSTHTCLEA
ncbi:MAG TPA: serine/threonine-protein kinase [Candidatus Paceibacterota bacterium]|nr:serine/threonine-protein kinase [Verrucomicrobiota bacterium]HRY51579.1 serine/threonine-protein kinase [Candidatus Paceibacterota bacterium]